MTYHGIANILSRRVCAIAICRAVDTMKNTHLTADPFYDQLAPHYHLKVDWLQRRAKEAALFEYLLPLSPTPSVLDLGCGDGGHAPFITQPGLSYIGVDRSEKMIAMANRHHRHRRAKFIVGDMLRLPADWNGRFGLCLLLGNTLPHLHTVADRDRLFAAVLRVLAPGGRFVIQIVNPEPMRGKSMSAPPARFGKRATLFLPLYLRRGRLWDFVMEIVRFDQGKIAEREILLTRLRIWTLTELLQAARKIGMTVHAIFGGAGLAPYDADRSENLLIIFEKRDDARTTRSRNRRSRS